MERRGGPRGTLLRALARARARGASLGRLAALALLLPACQTPSGLDALGLSAPSALLPLERGRSPARSASVSWRAQRAAARRPSTERVVVLLIVDGVRPEDLFDDALSARLPALRAIEARGSALGARGDFLATGPHYVSLPGYLELLSGVGPVPCADNDCPLPALPTLFDELPRTDQAGARRGPPALVASWAPLAGVVGGPPERALVSAGRAPGRGLEHLGAGELRELYERTQHAAPGPNGLRADAHTAALALAYLSEQRPPLLVVALGETDEFGHAGERDGYLRALERADAVARRTESALAALEGEGYETLLLVTTDHGRSADLRDHGRPYPESARCFLLAAGSLARPLGKTALPGAALRDVAPTIRLALGLPEQRGAGRGRALSELLRE